MLISIIIPAFNEERTIKTVVSKVKQLKLSGILKKEIIVIDDASTDKTAEILKKIKGIRIYGHKKNSGKGAAVSNGFKKSRGDILLIQDADLEYDPRYIPKLLDPIVKGKTEVVYGTRLKDYPLRLTGAKRTPLLMHYLGNKFLSLITTLLYGVKVSDMETGYKVFRKDVIRGIDFKSKRFDFEPEFTSKILKRGYKILEIPIIAKPRGYDEGKKITWKDGIAALKTLLKYRFFD
jgi:dolichol-phosphate mannosyltransferase